MSRKSGTKGIDSEIFDPLFIKLFHELGPCWVEIGERLGVGPHIAYYHCKKLLPNEVATALAAKLAKRAVVKATQKPVLPPSPLKHGSIHYQPPSSPRFNGVVEQYNPRSTLPLLPCLQEPVYIVPGFGPYEK